jgi:DNA-binding response OmpR family regulator
MSVVPSEVVARLRHDLRTYVNHLQGYGEMVLESLQDAGASSTGDVERLLEIGKDLLVRIQDALPPGRDDLTEAAVAANLKSLKPPATEAGALADKLLQQAQQEDHSEVAGDLQKIRRAMAEFANVLAGGLATSTPHNEAASAATTEPTAATPAAASSTGATILVVDDIESNRDLLGRRLEREGHRVVMAANGKQALERIAAGGLDLVLLDILMPEVDGFTVLQTVKAKPEGRDLPIIMISSLDEIQSVVRCIEMGAEDFLPKPFDPVLLRARVGACLEKKRFRDQELAYLHNVALVTAAAASIEAGAFDPSQLDSVAVREDALGRLARVFQRMGKEVQAREERLKNQVQQLKIEIDEARKKTQVAEVTETDYFQELQKKAKDLRRRRP